MSEKCIWQGNVISKGENTGDKCCIFWRTVCAMQYECIEPPVICPNCSKKIEEKK